VVLVATLESNDDRLASLIELVDLHDCPFATRVMQHLRALYKAEEDRCLGPELRCRIRRVAMHLARVKLDVVRLVARVVPIHDDGLSKAPSRVPHALSFVEHLGHKRLVFLIFGVAVILVLIALDSHRNTVSRSGHDVL